MDSKGYRCLTSIPLQRNGHHISGKENPADLPSEGGNVKILSSGEWFHGTDFLQKINHYPTVNKEPEQKKPVLVMVTVGETTLFDVSQYSSWNKAVRIFARFFHYKERFLHRINLARERLPTELQGKEIQ